MKQSRSLFTKLLVVTLIAGTTLWSCKQDETDPTAVEAQVQTDSNIETSAEVQEEADRLQTEMDELEKSLGNNIDNARTSETITFKKCATVTITRDATAGTRTVVIDYGNGCADSTAAQNGVTITRTGKLTIVYTGKWREQNTVKTMTFESFAISLTKDGTTLTRTVNGTRIVTNQSTITFDLITGLGGTPKYRIQNDLTITLPQLDADRPAREVTYKSDKVKTWTEGFGSLNPFDDVFTETGEFSGVNRRGVAYTAVIEEAVTHKTECWKSLVFMPASGKVKYTSANAVASVDYGDGTCDRKVTVTVNGNTYEFERK
ncbi:MAG TPA: hypothetical protein DCS93_25205 [Microscillaceae bacterium]|nr:hypothetical protein [Microscillaceae bacterium]